jgi:hypothetical protein
MPEGGTAVDEQQRGLARAAIIHAVDLQPGAAKPPVVHEVQRYRTPPFEARPRAYEGGGCWMLLKAYFEVVF